MKISTYLSRPKILRVYGSRSSKEESGLVWIEGRQPNEILLNFMQTLSIIMIRRAWCEVLIPDVIKRGNNRWCNRIYRTPLKTAAPMESHAATILTPYAFCKLQEELVLAAHCITSGERLLSCETPYKNCPRVGWEKGVLDQWWTRDSCLGGAKLLQDCFHIDDTKRENILLIHKMLNCIN